MIPVLLLAAAVEKPISFAKAAALLAPPAIVAYVATEKGIASGAHEMNPLMNTSGKRLAAQVAQVAVCSLVVHKVSLRSRKAGKWTLGAFATYKWIEGGWDVHIALWR